MQEAQGLGDRHHERNRRLFRGIEVNYEGFQSDIEDETDKRIYHLCGKESQMKIESSSIAMRSTHHEASYSYKESMTMEAAKSKDAAGAILTLSKEASGQSLKESMLEYQKQEKQGGRQRQKENEARSLLQMAERKRPEQKGPKCEVSDEYAMKIKMLKQMLAALSGKKLSALEKELADMESNVLDLRSMQYRQMESMQFGLAGSVGIRLDGAQGASTPASADGGATAASPRRGTTPTGTVWQKITAVSGYEAEIENTTFASKGIVKTADGREIDFNVEVSMSRACMNKFDALEVKEYIKVDPLIINMDTDIASVSDQKFFFDLDADGDEEEISFAGEGSGFLAIDKNNDGVINDGSELFGPKSGDGFKDLAVYDGDGNGWIDENDDIFSKLKVWTKDENGEDILLDLKQADVGALYLRNADTQFSLKDDENRLNAEVKKTGIYLKESTGEVGTMNHVDLAL